MGPPKFSFYSSPPRPDWGPLEAFKQSTSFFKSDPVVLRTGMEGGLKGTKTEARREEMGMEPRCWQQIDSGHMLESDHNPGRDIHGQDEGDRISTCFLTEQLHGCSRCMQLGAQAQGEPGSIGLNVRA